MNNEFLYMHQLIDTVLNVRFSDLEKERKCCEELLELSHHHAYVYATAFAYTYLGDYYLAQNDAMLSGQYLYEARQLCSRDIYPVLYMKVCHLSGFYYHLVNDEQNALQYYLESISLAQEMGDVYQVCNAWNNIADMYQRHKQYKEAKKYYTNAYQFMCEQKLGDVRLRVIVLYNLAEVNGYMHAFEEMETYLDECEKLIEQQEDNEPLYHLSCHTGRFLQAAFQKDQKHAKQIAEEIMKCEFYGMDDQYLIIEFLMPIARELVLLKEKENAKKYIDLLDSFSSMNELSFVQRLVDLRVLFAENFSSEEELFEKYKEYCHTTRKIITMEDDVRVSGMNAKIHLQEIIQEHETMLQVNKRLEDEVRIDDLTNIYNRRYFNGMAENIDNTYHTIAIIMLDVDYFKEYNDTYGHIHGDLVLRRIGDTLKKCSNEHILPCRYGGDEFICLCKNQDKDKIEQYIKEVQVNIGKQKMEHKRSKCSDQVTLSIGYCTTELTRDRNVQDVLNHADEALYYTKANGRNGWSYYESSKDIHYYSVINSDRI